jgi:hypothetical protein
MYVYNGWICLPYGSFPAVFPGWDMLAASVGIVQIRVTTKSFGGGATLQKHQGQAGGKGQYNKFIFLKALHERIVYECIKVASFLLAQVKDIK